MTLYDTIGRRYAKQRREDARLGAAILDGLGDARSVVNVGAGAGSYEPRDRRVVAVEPSRLMIRQRGGDAAPVVRASATDLPFRDASFDASLAVLTVHHWPDRQRGLGELRRCARRTVVIVTWDPSFPGFWLTDYFPEILDVDRRIFPSMSELSDRLGPIVVKDLAIPHDCTDGFLGAYWRRPEAYLDADVRSAISTFSKLDPGPGLARLREELASGAWHRRHGSVMGRSDLDLGYRLVVASRGTGHPGRVARLAPRSERRASCATHRGADGVGARQPGDERRESPESRGLPSFLRHGDHVALNIRT